MLQLFARNPLEEPNLAHSHGKDQGDYFDVRSILAAVRRQLKIILLCALFGALAGILFVTTSVPLFTATTSIMMDRRQVRAVQDVSAVTEVGLVDPSIVVDSQVEILKSEKIALAVVDGLDLTDDQMFWTNDGWLLSWLSRSADRTVRSLISLVGDKPASTPDEARARETARWTAAYRLLRRTTIGRVGNTYLISISYTGANADQSARIVNAYVEAYLTDQLEGKYDSTRRANAWLLARLEDLRQKAVDSDLAVQQFRATNSLIAVGGQLVTDLQLSELNTQLATARGDVARTGARLDRIRYVLRTNQVEASIGEGPKDNVINDLQTRHIESGRREAEITARFGPDHERAVQYRSEKAQIRNQILSELESVAQSYESDFEVAKARLEELQRNVNNLISVAAGANAKLVRLRELERAADTYKGLYDIFTQRYQQTIQQQSFPLNDARVVTPATPPLQPSQPKPLVSIVLSALVGALIGGAWGGVREYRDGSVRTGRDIREELGLRFLGLLPVISIPHVKKPHKFGFPIGEPPKDPREVSHALTRLVDLFPESRFAENLRSVAVSLAGKGSESSKVIGVLSVNPREGRSLVAANLATLLGQGEGPTLLIDADTRNPHLSRILAPDATVGLLDVLAGTYPWKDALRRGPVRPVEMLPMIRRPELPHPSHFLSGEQIDEVLQDAAAHFKYIVLDLPPLSVASEARVLARKVDCVLLVVKWGETSKELIREILTADEVVKLRCSGAILNAVDMTRIRQYQECSHGGAEPRRSGKIATMLGTFKWRPQS
jgi:succinoglycan biosynthesis transport protein ExoP